MQLLKAGQLQRFIYRTCTDLSTINQVFKLVRSLYVPLLPQLTPQSPTCGMHSMDIYPNLA